MAVDVWRERRTERGVEGWPEPEGMNARSGEEGMRRSMDNAP